MSKYLYGAAVQGIQNFIFQTNRLREIVGASALVENICTDLFWNFIKDPDYDVHSIIHAAGNIKHVFESEEICRRVVREFPKCVAEYAPGITLSQAVVQLDDNMDFGNCANELEEKLRAQRNKPMPSTTFSLMAMHRSRSANMPAIDYLSLAGKDMEYIDAATFAKCFHVHNGIRERRNAMSLCKKAFGIHNLSCKQIAFDTTDITEQNDWIAIIHADGNGLGRIVQKYGHKQDEFKRFSQDLDKNTKAAAVSAFEYIKEKYHWKEIIPIRPIVLGGDDFTVICRADLALDYVRSFIEHFERNNSKYNLTACAGIAYVKSSYPFYYGYELAEALCAYAKKDAKSFNQELPASCIQMHKVQDSFVEEYKDIIKRELEPTSNINFAFGPYYVSDNPLPGARWTIAQLIEKANLLDCHEGNAVKSNLRQWLTLLYKGETEKAEQKRIRMKELYRGNSNRDNSNMRGLIDEVTKETKRHGTEGQDVRCYPVYDILVQHTLNTQTTKTNE